MREKPKCNYSNCTNEAMDKSEYCVTHDAIVNDV